jgi:hypothetical protein
LLNLDPHPPVPSLRCWLSALLAAWVVQIFGTSALLAGMQEGGLSSPSAVWIIADAVGPLAKIGYVAVLALLLAPWRRRHLAAVPTVCIWALASVAALLGVLALLPAEFSRGFGIGYDGARFSPATLPAYVAAAALAGLLGALLQRRCYATGPDAA